MAHEGAAGTCGSAVVGDLLKRGVSVRALSRKQPEPGELPQGVEIVSERDLKDAGRKLDTYLEAQDGSDFWGKFGANHVDWATDIDSN